MLYEVDLDPLVFQNAFRGGRGNFFGGRGGMPMGDVGYGYGYRPTRPFRGGRARGGYNFGPAPGMFDMNYPQYPTMPVDYYEPQRPMGYGRPRRMRGRGGRGPRGRGRGGSATGPRGDHNDEGEEAGHQVEGSSDSEHAQD